MMSSVGCFGLGEAKATGGEDHTMGYVLSVLGLGLAALQTNMADNAMVWDGRRWGTRDGDGGDGYLVHALVSFFIFSHSTINTQPVVPCIRRHKKFDCLLSSLCIIFSDKAIRVYELLVDENVTNTLVTTTTTSFHIHRDVVCVS